MTQPPILPPSLTDIEQMARDAAAALPPQFAEAAAPVLLRIEDFPLEGMLEDLGLEDPYELTGMYDGIPLTEKSLSDPQHRPDCIWLFRRAILEEWIERGDVTLHDLVAHVYVHELAHHFGWSDEDIATVDRWWE